MKKLLLLSSALCLAIGSQAQSEGATATSGSKIHIAPEIGVNVGNMQGKLAGEQTSYKGAKLGVKAGVNADIMLGNNFAIQPGIFYSIKGGKRETDLGMPNATFKENFTLHYLEVPLNFQWYFNDPNEGRFFIGIGGYVATPIGGKNKYYTHVEGMDDVNGTKDIHFGVNNDTTVINGHGWKHFDAGVSANAGYYLRSGIFFRAMVQRGLTNNYDGGNQDNKLKLNTYSLSIGYMIGGKR